MVFTAPWVEVSQRIGVPSVTSSSKAPQRLGVQVKVS